MKAGVALVLCAFLIVAPGAVQAQTPFADEGLLAPLNERILNLRGAGKHPPALEVTLLTPAGRGPFPLAVVNHGSAVAGQKPAAMARYRDSFVAFYFLSRGYAVALPMLRGYAGSGGAPWSAACDVAGMGIENARDIDAVMRKLARERDIDASRVVVAGQSLGGWITLAQGALAGHDVKGLINFAGELREPDCRDQDIALAIGATRLGRLTRIPSIWFYGDNDAILPPNLSRAMFDAYTSSGGPARLVDIGVWPGDAHEFAASLEALKIWTPAVDVFLASVGLPSKTVYQQYMPSPPLPPSHFAAIDDVDALPFSDPTVKATYRRFLTFPMPRAFVLSKDGAAAFHGGFDPVASTLRDCRENSTRCAVYAYDNDVVWAGWPPAPTTEAPATEPPSYSLTVHPDTTTRLAFFYELQPDCSSRGLASVQVTARPAHGVAVVAQSADFPNIATGSFYMRCKALRVPGVALTYTPSRGFLGVDTLTFDELEPGDQERTLRVDITVK